MKAIVRHKHQVQQVKASNPLSPGGHFRFVAAEVQLPAGSWVVFAKADVQNISAFPQIHTIRCFLAIIGADAIEDRSDAGLEQGVRQTINLIVGTNVQESATAELSCSVSFEDKFQISNIAMSAMQVETVDELIPLFPGIIPFPTAIDPSP